jgi:hypothetical protein
MHFFQVLYLTRTGQWVPWLDLASDSRTDLISVLTTAHVYTAHVTQLQYLEPQEDHIYLGPLSLFFQLLI